MKESQVGVNRGKGRLPLSCRVFPNEPVSLHTDTLYGTEEVEFRFRRPKTVMISCRDLTLTRAELFVLADCVNYGLTYKGTAYKRGQRYETVKSLIRNAFDRNEEVLGVGCNKTVLAVAAETRGLLDPPFVSFVEETF